MGTKKLCACDLTRESLVKVEVDLVDTVHEPIAAIAEDLTHVSNKGYWLNPFRGIPKSRGLSRFDLVYLDDRCRVVECAENFAEVEFQPVSGGTASALVLPSHTISSAQIHQGDQLRICSAGVPFAELGDPGERSAQHNGASPAEAIRCVKDADSFPSQPAATLDEKAILQADKQDTSETPEQEKPSLKARFLRWLFPDITADRRLGNRRPLPGLIAYYWTGGAPQAFRLRDVSPNGFYLLTEERWIEGTRIMMTLQMEATADENIADTACVESQVVRWGEDGVGFKFVQSEFVDLNSGELVSGKRFEKVAFQQFLDRLAVPNEGQHIN